MEKIIILDGNAIIHRAYHGVPPLTTKEGVMVNAVYGFVSMLFRVWRDLKPTYIVAAFDVAGGTFRHEKFVDYKGKRVKADQALYDQIPLVHEVVEALGIPIFEKKGYEADDVIGTIVEKCKEKGKIKSELEIYIVTGDMDTLQLVMPGVKVYTLRKGLNDVVVYDNEEVKKRFGFGPELVIDYKALRGDTSDNIPGVPGIGEKTATELLQKVGDLAAVYALLKKDKDRLASLFKPGVIKKLEEGEKSAHLSRELATIDLAVPDLGFELEKCRLKPLDRERIISLFQKWEFVSLLKRIPELTEGDALKKGIPSVKNNTAVPKSVRSSKKSMTFVEIKTKEDVLALRNLIQTSGQFSCRALVNNSDVLVAVLQGVVVVVKDTSFWVEKPWLKELATIFSDKSIELSGHDLKQFLKILWHTAQIEVKNKLFDCMIASYLLNPGSRAHDAESVVLKILGKETTPNLGQTNLFGVDARTAAYELGLIHETVPLLRAKLVEANNFELFEKIEMGLIPVLGNMELAGILVDREKLTKLSGEIREDIDNITKEIYSLSGTEFNIASPIQLREVLFEKMAIPAEGLKKGKTGLSTSAESLEKLHGQHPIIEKIETYRELCKLQNTYVDVLPSLIHKVTGRIHTSFNQAVAATGRLSSSDPNLQNIPVRTELGRKIREAFVAKPGSVLLAADYSQMELRIVASLAKDERMTEIFNQGLDIHSATAAAINNVPLEEVTKEMRYAAKEINFGILYGMGTYGLSWRAHLPHWQAKEFIAKYFEQFSGVKKFMEETLVQARTQGYVETLFGRRRYLPDIMAQNFQLRSAAERMAINHPVQGTLADVIKLAMIEVDRFLKKEQTKFLASEAPLLLQVHDELVFEVVKEHVYELGEMVKDVMERVVTLHVPVKVEVKTGANWQAMSPVQMPEKKK